MPNPPADPDRGDEVGGTDGAPGGGLYEWWRRGVDLLERGDAAAAAVLLERAVAADPGAASCWEALGRARYDAGDFARAVDAFDELVRLAPDSHYGHFALGLSLTRVDRFERGAEHLAMAATMQPGRAEYVDRLRQARATLRARADLREQTERELEERAAAVQFPGDQAPAGPAARDTARRTHEPAVPQGNERADHGTTSGDGRPPGPRPATPPPVQSGAASEAGDDDGAHGRAGER
ncbi:tetratricopeptide repeat protein [Angustibacter aerolatus]